MEKMEAAKTKYFTKFILKKGDKKTKKQNNIPKK